MNGAWEALGTRHLEEQTRTEEGPSLSGLAT